MTASVSGYSIIQGFTSTLDTMLPSAWTSSQPQLVGLWSQRMGQPFPMSALRRLNEFFAFAAAVVMAACLVVGNEVLSSADARIYFDAAYHLHLVQL